MSATKPKQPHHAPAQSTAHPETAKPGKLGSPPPAGATETPDPRPDARTSDDRDGNAQQVPDAARRPKPKRRT